jgi:hypothetical protein
MTRPTQAVVCSLAEGDSLDAFCTCLESVLAHTPHERIELRCAFGGAPDGLAYALGTLCPDDVLPRQQALPGGVRRFDLTAADGLRLWAWDAPVRFGRARLLRHLFFDVPLSAEYAVWLDQGTAVTAGWWDELAPLLEGRVDYIGHADWHGYRPGEAERRQTEGWYLGVPVERRDGKAGVAFCREGLIAVRAERLREASFPPVRATGPLDVLLGEMAHQLGWTRGDLHEGHEGTRRIPAHQGIAAE